MAASSCEAPADESRLAWGSPKESSMSESIPVVIRKATLRDAEGIAKVHVDTWRSAYQDIIPDKVLKELSYEQRQNRWEQNITEAKSDIYVAALKSGDIIGFVTCGPTLGADERLSAETLSASPPSAAEVHALYLRKELQGQGIGKRLLQHAAQTLMRKGHYSMFLWVLQQNGAACRFYKSQGGVKVGMATEEIGGSLLPTYAFLWRHIPSSPLLRTSGLPLQPLNNQGALPVAHDDDNETPIGDSFQGKDTNGKARGQPPEELGIKSAPDHRLASERKGKLSSPARETEYLVYAKPLPITEEEVEGKPVVLREGRLEDAAGIAKVQVDTWRSAYAGILPRTFLLEASYEERRKRWERTLALGERNVHVACLEDGEPVGFISCGPARHPKAASQETDKTTEYNLPDGEIYALYVRQELQGLGIGKLLLRKGAECLLKLGYSSMFLWTFEQNEAACRFYEAQEGQKTVQVLEETAGVELPVCAYEWHHIPSMKLMTSQTPALP